jgi:HK97 family phage prohead protease
MTEVLQRAIAATAVEVEGRTVDVRLCRFGETAEVADPPTFRPYMEEFLPGCFDHQLKAANRVHANYEHMRGPSNIVGHGVNLRAERDGYYLTATIHKTAGGDATLELLNAGALPDVSMEFLEVRNVRRGSIMQRAKANLIGFAFARVGSYASANVLAVRTDTDGEPQTLSAELLPTDIDPERVKRLRAQGIVLPDRYQAHPEDDGTPAVAGTPSVSAPASEAKPRSEENSDARDTGREDAPEPGQRPRGDA